MSVPTFEISMAALQRLCQSPEDRLTQEEREKREAIRKYNKEVYDRAVEAGERADMFRGLP